MPIVFVPGVGDVEFPDEMTPEQIGVAIRQDILPQVEKRGFTPGLSAGITSLTQEVPRGIQLGVGLDEPGARAGLAAAGEEAAQEFQGTPWEDVKEAWSQRGLGTGITRTSEFLRGSLGQSLPIMSPMIAGGAAGTAVGGPVGGLIGALGAGTATYFGLNVARQAEEQAAAQAAGQTPQELDRLRAIGAAPVQAGLDVLPLGRIFKGTPLGRILGQEGDDAARATINQIIEEGTAPSVAGAVGRGAGRGVLYETPTEVTQTILERWQAGLDLTSPDAYKEYEAAAAGGAGVGGTLGVGAGAWQRSRVIGQAEEEKRQLEAQRREVEELEAARRARVQEGMPDGGFEFEGAEGAFPRPQSEAGAAPVDDSPAAVLRRNAEVEAARRNSMTEGRRPRSWTADEVMQEERSSVMEEVRRLEAERDRRMAAGDAAGAGDMQKRVVAGHELYSDLGGLAPKAAENNAKAIESTRKKLEKLERDLKDADTAQKVEKAVKGIDDNRKKLAELEAQRTVLEEAQAPEGQMGLPFDGAAAVAATRPGIPAGDVLTAEDLKPLGRGRVLRDLEGADLSTVEGLQHAREVIEGLPPATSEKTNAAREAMLQEIARREQAQQAAPEAEAEAAPEAEAEAAPVETEAVEGSLAAELDSEDRTQAEEDAAYEAFLADDAQRRAQRTPRVDEKQISKNQEDRARRWAEFDAEERRQREEAFDALQQQRMEESAPGTQMGLALTGGRGGQPETSAQRPMTRTDYLAAWSGARAAGDTDTQSRIDAEAIEAFGRKSWNDSKRRITSRQRDLFAEPRDEAIDQTVREATVPGREGARAERAAAESGVGVAGESAQPNTASRGAASEQGRVDRSGRPARGASQRTGAQPRALEVTNRRRVRVEGEGTHTELTLSNGAVRRIQKMNAAGTAGLPGWHDLDVTGPMSVSYLGDTEAEATAALLGRESRRQGEPRAVQDQDQEQETAPRQDQEAEPETVAPRAQRTPEERIADLEDRIADLDNRIADSRDDVEQGRLEGQRDALDEQLRKLNLDRRAQSRLSEEDRRAEVRDAEQADKVGEDVEAQVQPDEGESDRRASGTTAPEAEGQPAAEMEGKLRAAFNNPAAFRNRVTIVQSVNDLPADIKRSFDEAEAQGFVPAAMFDGNTNRVYMVADRVPAGKELGVFLHETGVHMGMESLLGPELYKSQLSQIDKWAKDGKGEEGRLARLAAERAGQNEEAGFQANDETLAYFVEEAVNSGIDPTALKGNSPLVNWFRRMMGAIRTALRALGMRPTAYNAQDVVDLAYGGADLALQGVGVAPATSTQAAKFSGSRADAERILASAGRSLPVEQNKTFKQSITEVSKKYTPSAQLGSRLYDKVMQMLDVSYGLSEARRAVSQMKDWPERAKDAIKDGLLAQIGHRQAMSIYALEFGGIQQSAGEGMFITTESSEFRGGAKRGMTDIKTALADMGKKYDMTESEVAAIVNDALEGRRMVGIYDWRDTEFARAAAMEANTKPSVRKEGKALREKLEGMQMHITRQQAEALTELFDRFPEIKKIEQYKNEVREWVADFLVESGVWSREEADVMLENADWVPFKREFSEEEILNRDAFLTHSDLGPKVQFTRNDFRFKGSNRPVDNILSNFEQWASASIANGIRNGTTATLVKDAVRDGYATEVTQRTDKNRNKVVTYVENGEQKFVEFDLEVQAAMFNSGLASPAVSGVLAFFNNVFRNSIIALPTFSAKQLGVDTQEAMIRSGLPPQQAIKIGMYTAQAMGRFLKGEESTAFKELRSRGLAGAATDLAVLRGEELRAATGSDRLVKKPKAGKLGEMWVKARNAGLRGAMYSDNAVREGIYLAALDSGLSIAEASKLAADYINFRRTVGNQSLARVAAYVPFFSAALAAQRASLSVLGNRSLSSAARNDARKRYFQNAAVLAALSTLLAAANSEDEEYENMSVEQRARQMTIPGTGGFGIPRRVTIDLLVPIAAEMAYNQAVGSAKDSTAVSTAVRGMLGEILFPVPEPVPAPVKVALEQIGNYNSFTGAPIVGHQMSQREAHLQYTNSTSELAKLIGAGSNAVGAGDTISPQRIDHILRGTFGSAGAVALMLTNGVFGTVTGRPLPTARDVLTSVPGFTFPAAKEFNNADKNDLYDLMKRVQQVTTTANELKKRGLGEDYRAYVEENRELMQFSSRLRRVSDQLSKIRRQITVVSESDMPRGKKTDEIRRLREIEKRYIKTLDVKGQREKAGL